MVSYVSSLFSYIFSRNHKTEDDNDKEDYLAQELLDLEITEEQKSNNDLDTNKNNNDTQEIPRNVSCFERTGVVTYIDGNDVFIDGMHYFDQSACSLSLSNNDKVVYLGYKKEEKLVIVRILQNLGFMWDDENNTEESQFEVIDHIIVGEVQCREERRVIIKDSDLTFSLDEVEGVLVPVQGDWLEMKCSVQYNEEKPSDISATQVIKVISFKPLRRKIKNAQITEWNGEYGTCNRVMYFNSQCFSLGFQPKIGLNVTVEAIESNQGPYAWRIINIILNNNANKNNIPSIENSEIQDSIHLEKQHNLDVTYPLAFQNIDFNAKKHIDLLISNTGHELQIINKWILVGSRKDSQVSITPYLLKPFKLLPGNTFKLTITCKPKFFGSSKEHLVIMMRGFKIERLIDISVITDHIKADLNTTKQAFTTEQERIQRLKNMRKGNDNNYCIPGERPIKPPNFISVQLGSYNVPDKVWAVVLGDSQQVVHTVDFNGIMTKIEDTFPFLTKDLNINNYLDVWHTLLYMEEIQENINIRVYDMKNVFLIRCQEYLSLEINNLSEKRPSLVVGDKVIVEDVWDQHTQKYEGYIHVVKGNFVLMKFNKRFHEKYCGSDVSVEFHFTRTKYRRSHKAVTLALSNLGPDILFPKSVSYQLPLIPVEKMTSIEWFNKKLNEGQKTAVTNILLGQCRPKPYCIYGPPGTGKTITVIETILQILINFPDSRILVATPSNSAANLITQRLLEFKDKITSSFIRILANYLVDSDLIPKEIKPYCATLDIAREGTTESTRCLRNGINLHCPKSYIGRHRVTIGTCYCLGTLIQMGFPKGHFTHIIVDEAGQATEPEVMIPLTFIDKTNGQIILAGDPMQLGPIIASRYCQEFGMRESYLARILETYPYQKDYIAYKNGYNNNLVTKLNDNYRSLEGVIKLPSQMFYDGTLVPKINPNQGWIKNILEIVTDIFPTESVRPDGIYVYGVRGTNMRAEESPSWYNPQEASMVALISCKLFKKNIQPDDIGIITPYIAQIKYLKTLFDSMGLPHPKIGTVEEFQGQERRIIIISTVRSSELYVKEDIRSCLGFIGNPKRINVALTRAQVAVFLFCNPHLLCKDPVWDNVISNAVKDDKYLGCDLPYRCE